MPTKSLSTALIHASRPCLPNTRTRDLHFQLCTQQVSATRSRIWQDRRDGLTSQGYGTAPVRYPAPPATDARSSSGDQRKQATTSCSPTFAAWCISSRTNPYFFEIILESGTAVKKSLWRSRRDIVGFTYACCNTKCYCIITPSGRPRNVCTHPRDAT